MLSSKAVEPFRPQRQTLHFTTDVVCAFSEHKLRGCAAYIECLNKTVAYGRRDKVNAVKCFFHVALCSCVLYKLGC